MSSSGLFLMNIRYVEFFLNSITIFNDITSRFLLICRQEDFAQQQREKEKEKKAPLTQPKKEDIRKKTQTETSAMTYRMLQAAKTLERMVNQNIFDDISQGIITIFVGEIREVIYVCTFIIIIRL